MTRLKEGGREEYQKGRKRMESKVTSLKLSEKGKGCFTIKTRTSGDLGKTRLVDFRHN